MNIINIKLHLCRPITDSTNHHFSLLELIWTLIKLRLIYVHWGTSVGNVATGTYHLGD